jgi:hypothetical protein
MNSKKNTGKETDAVTSLLPQAAVIEEINDALSHGYRRLFVVGPPHSRRLACLRQSLGSKGYKLVIIDLASVQSRFGLDAAVRRATLGKDFVDCMLRLERQSRRCRLAVVFHNIDESRDLSGEAYALDAVWMAAKCNYQLRLVVFTARNLDFPIRCFGRYKNDRAFVRLISFLRAEPGCASAGSGKRGRKS